MLLEAVRQDTWITYQNCHLNPGFLLEIARVLQSTPEIHEGFRLWLITESSNTFPSKVLQISIKGLPIMQVYNICCSLIPIYILLLVTI